jgi:hypothetical protein
VKSAAVWTLCSLLHRPNSRLAHKNKICRSHTQSNFCSQQILRSTTHAFTMLKSSLVNMLVLVTCLLCGSSGADFSREQPGFLRRAVNDAAYDIGAEPEPSGDHVHRSLSIHCTGWQNLPTGTCPKNRDGTDPGRIDCGFNFVWQPIVRNNGRCNRRQPMSCIPTTRCICDTSLNANWDCRESGAIDECVQPPAGAWAACTPST